LIDPLSKGLTWDDGFLSARGWRSNGHRVADVKNAGPSYLRVGTPITAILTPWAARQIAPMAKPFALLVTGVKESEYGQDNPRMANHSDR
jgi:hypothetical protein